MTGFGRWQQKSDFWVTNNITHDSLSNLGSWHPNILFPRRPLSEKCVQIKSYLGDYKENLSIKIFFGEVEIYLDFPAH